MEACLQYIQHRNKRIVDGVKKLGRRCGEAGLHNLRVDIKKQRAFYRLLRLVDPDFPYRDFYYTLKKVFAHGGVVREIHRQLHLLKDAGDIAHHFSRKYRRYLSNAYRLARNDFRDYAHKMQPPGWEEIEHPIIQALGNCIQPTLEEYFQQLRSQAEEIIDRLDVCSNEELHQLRKIIKDYEANRKMSSLYFRFETGPCVGLSIDTGALLEQLGLWHDYDTAWRRLKTDLSANYWSAADQLAGRQLLLRWQRRSNRMKQKLKKLLHTTTDNA